MRVYHNTTDYYEDQLHILPYEEYCSNIDPEDWYVVWDSKYKRYWVLSESHYSYWVDIKDPDDIRIEYKDKKEEAIKWVQRSKKRFDVL